MKVQANDLFHRPPKRDWRDWFIMATTVGGVGYGLYFVAKVSNAVTLIPPIETWD